MKRSKVLLFIFALGFAAQAVAEIDSISEIRAKRPEWGNLSDDAVVDVVREIYFPKMSREELADAIGVKLKPVFVPKSLGQISRWRYQSCQQEATKAPTPVGVSIGLGICKEKFEQ